MSKSDEKNTWNPIIKSHIPALVIFLLMSCIGFWIGCEPHITANLLKSIDAPIQEREEAIQKAVKRLHKSSSAGITSAAIKVLVMLDSKNPAHVQRISALYGLHPESDHWCAWALGEIRLVQSIPPLLQWIVEANAPEKAIAPIEALIKLVPILLEQPNLVLETIDTLNRLSGKFSIKPPLYDLQVALLQRINTLETRVALFNRSVDRFILDPNESERSVLYQAMQELFSFIRDHAFTMQQSQVALTLMNQAMDQWIKILQMEQTDLQVLGLWLVSQIPADIPLHQKSLDPLLGWIKHSNPTIRLIACYALFRIQLTIQGAKQGIIDSIVSKETHPEIFQLIQSLSMDEIDAIQKVFNLDVNP